MQDPTHENQVHNNVIDIALFFEGIEYKFDKTVDITLARFSIDGPHF